MAWPAWAFARYLALVSASWAFRLASSAMRACSSAGPSLTGHSSHSSRQGYRRVCTATGGVPHTYGCSAAAPSAASSRCTRRAVWLALAPVGWDAQSVIAPFVRRPIVHVVHSLTASAADDVSTTDYRTPGAEFSAALGCLEASRRRHTAARVDRRRSDRRRHALSASVNPVKR